MIEDLSVGPVGVRLKAMDARAASLVKNVSRYLHAEKAQKLVETPLELDIRVGAAEPVVHVGAHPLATFDNGFVLARVGDDVVLRRGNYLARLNVAAGKGTVWVPEEALGAQRWVACGVVLEGLLVLLRRHHLYSMHAAALVHEGRGVLIAASADSGKSTLAFRLVQSGWAYLSDDTILLHPTPAHVEVQGLRSHFSLDPEAEDIFPELAAGRQAALLKEEKWAVNVEALYPGQRVETCVPRLLLFPQIVDAAESRVSPISPREALGFLLAQSSLARVKLDGADVHLDVLGRLASDVPAYRLHSGRDLLDDPGRAGTLLASLVGDSV